MDRRDERVDATTVAGLSAQAWVGGTPRASGSQAVEPDRPTHVPPSSNRRQGVVCCASLFVRLPPPQIPIIAVGATPPPPSPAPEFLSSSSLNDMDEAVGELRLATLPGDVLELVVGWLGIADLVATASCCRSLRRACFASLRTVWLTRQFHGMIAVFRHGPRPRPWWELPAPGAKNDGYPDGRLFYERQLVLSPRSLRSFLSFFSKADLQEAHLSDLVGTTGEDMDDDQQVSTFLSVLSTPGVYEQQPPPTYGTPPRSWLSAAAAVTVCPALRRLSLRGLLTRADASMVAELTNSCYLQDLEVWGAVMPGALSALSLPAIPNLTSLFVRATGGDTSGLVIALTGRSLFALALPRMPGSAAEAALAATAALPRHLFIPSDRTEASMAVDGAAVARHPAAGAVEVLSLWPVDVVSFLAAAGTALYGLKDLTLHVSTGLGGSGGWPAGLKPQRLRLLSVLDSPTEIMEELVAAVAASASLQQTLIYLLVESERLVRLETARELGRLRSLRRLVLGTMFTLPMFDPSVRQDKLDLYEEAVRTALPADAVLHVFLMNSLPRRPC